MVRPAVSSQPRVSCTSGSPRSRASVWRSTSKASARSRERKLLRFFTSTLVPKADEPAGRTLTLPSIRMLPASMSALLAPMARSSSRSVSPYARACAGERRSGSVTISISGTPARLKSTTL